MTKYPALYATNPHRQPGQHQQRVENTRQRSIPTPVLRVSWGDSAADVPDLTAAIAATFGRMEQKA